MDQPPLIEHESPPEASTEVTLVTSVEPVLTMSVALQEHFVKTQAMESSQDQEPIITSDNELAQQESVQMESDSVKEPEAVEQDCQPMQIDFSESALTESVREVIESVQEVIESVEKEHELKKDTKQSTTEQPEMIENSDKLVTESKPKDVGTEQSMTEQPMTEQSEMIENPDQSAPKPEPKGANIEQKDVEVVEIMENDPPAAVKPKKQQTEPLAVADTVDEEMGDVEYIVERILDKKLDNGVIKYLVKWQGYPMEDNSWEPVENLFDCDKAMRAFEVRRADELAKIYGDESSNLSDKTEVYKVHKVNSVEGLTLSENQRYYLLNLDNSMDKPFMRASLANRLIPDKVIDFYLKNLIWKEKMC